MENEYILLTREEVRYLIARLWQASGFVIAHNNTILASILTSQAKMLESKQCS